MARRKIYTVSFISDYGKLWELDYTMDDDESVDEIIAARINGVSYKIKTESRSYRVWKAAHNHGVNFYQNARECDYEAAETHHMVDND